MNRGSRQFFRSGGGAGPMGGGPNGGPRSMPRRRGGQFARRRTPSGGLGYRTASFSDDRNDSSPPPPNPGRHDNEPPYNPSGQAPNPHPYGFNRRQTNNYNDNRNFNSHDDRNQQHISRRNYHDSDNEFNEGHNYNQPNNSGPSKKIEELSRLFANHKSDVDEVRSLLNKLTGELETVKRQIRELESNTKLPESLKPGVEGTTNVSKRSRKFKPNKTRERAPRVETSQQQNDTHQGEENEKQTHNVDQDAEITTKMPKFIKRTNRQKNTRRDVLEGRDKSNRNSLNEDSTTQPAEPSSEDRIEGDDIKDSQTKSKVIKRKKLHIRRHEQQRRHHEESSDRNSNDTSPQNETNGTDNNGCTGSSISGTYESHIAELIETLKRQFINSEKPMRYIKTVASKKGPTIPEEFSAAILDYAICDVTSPTKLSEIAKNLQVLLMLTKVPHPYENYFNPGFYKALSSISDREGQIVIDAPRYLDTLGRVLGEVLVNMNGRRAFQKKFLHQCVQAYGKQNRTNLLISIMKSIASVSDERAARDVWDMSGLNWSDFLEEGLNVEEFVKSHDVEFTIKDFSPEPQKRTNSLKELEKFADDVTNMVEGHCSTQDLDDLMKGLKLGPADQVEYLGTQIYAIVRGCLDTESGSYKLNNEALGRYSSILTTKHGDQEAIALNALTALTKLWHQYQCPQDLLRTTFMELHNMGAVTYDTLNTWLTSDSLTNIPGIGAARLNSKRYIEDLGATVKPQAPSSITVA